MAHFGRINVTNPIGAYVNQDDKDPTQYIVYVVQSGSASRTAIIIYRRSEVPPDSRHYMAHI